MKNNYFKSFLILLAISTTPNFSFAQCLTDHFAELYNQSLQNADAVNKAMEAEVAAYSASQNANLRRDKIIIPVVFHVVHTNGPENISRAQILDQLKTLNEDFSQSNADQADLRNQFKDRAANMEIEFALAKIDPNGNCTEGIARYFSAQTNDATEAIKAIKGAQWNYRKYLNIYVVKSIESSGVSGIILGYARFPYQTSSSTDGIVIRADRVGSIEYASSQSLGKTLTHEVGHWIGLFHTFQGGCSTNGDLVADTPPAQSSESNRNCNPASNSCSNDFPDELDLWENYMDYSGDDCMNMFTTGQKTRANFFMSSNTWTRAEMSTNTNLIATGIIGSTTAPLASFTSSTRVVCVGEPVLFTDGSCKGVVSTRTWSFEGGDVATSSIMQPSVTYSEPGKYKVSLTVSNAAGNSSMNLDEYIEVLPVEGRFNRRVSEQFEEGAEGLDAFEISSNMRFSSSAGFNSNQSVFAPIASNTPVGTIFEITSKDLNAKHLRGLNVFLNFQVAYAPDNNGAAESFRVLISKNCGSDYQQIFFRRGTLMGRVTNSTDSYIPSTDAEWRTHSLSLRNHLQDNDSNFRIKIEITGNGGNSVYVDNINFSQFPTAIVSVKKQEIVVYPNPANDALNVVLLENTKTVEIWDLEGRLIKSLTLTNTEIAQKTLLIPIYNLTNGAYIVRFTSDNNIFAQRIFVKR